MLHGDMTMGYNGIIQKTCNKQNQNHETMKIVKDLEFLNGFELIS